MLFGVSEIRAIAGVFTPSNIEASTSPKFLKQLEFQLEANTVKDAARVAERIKDAIQPDPALSEIAILLGAICGSIQPQSGLSLGLAIGRNFLSSR